MENFYRKNPSIPLFRRPNLIHICGKYFAIRALPGMSNFNPETGESSPLVEGMFYSFSTDPDVQAIMRVLEALQLKAVTSTHILYNYSAVIEGAMRS